MVDEDALLDGVTSIGIDETGWGHHGVMTVVVGHDRCRVIWAGEGVGGGALQPFFDMTVLKSGFFSPVARPAHHEDRRRELTSPLSPTRLRGQPKVITTSYV